MNSAAILDFIGLGLYSQAKFFQCLALIFSSRHQHREGEAVVGFVGLILLVSLFLPLTPAKWFQINELLVLGTKETVCAKRKRFQTNGS